MIPQNYPLYACNDENDWFVIIGWVKEDKKMLGVKRYAPLVVPITWSVNRAFPYMGTIEQLTTTAPELVKDDE